MKDQPLLDIQLLGAFRLKYQDQEIRQGITSRLESLLAYLVLHRQGPIPRQRLAFLFWPDTSEKQAHNNLRNLLFKLRTVLPEADSYLSIEQSTLQWQPSLPFNLDVDRFISLADRTNSIQDLEGAIQIYAGDFLPDCFDDWTHPVREDLRQTYLGTLENLLLVLAENRRPREALPYAQTLLRQDPTREETYIHLMRLHAQCGDRASVARVFKTCVTVLERELGVQPGPATQEAYQEFLVQEVEWVSPYEKVEYLSHKHIPNNLTSPLTRLIGRDRERVQVRDLLSSSRLVTLTGPGGIGKTRLALAVARELLSDYRDGIFLVDLAPVLDSKAVPSVIADALQAGEVVRAAGLDGLKDFLSDQRLFLLLDNCEHLVEEVGLICQALLVACPQLTVLVTSREALKIYGESLWQVPALLTPVAVEKPDPGHGPVLIRVLRSNESVELFIDRAVSALPTFKANDEALFSIGEICRRLDGMPLAIEMAAARVKTFSVQQIVQRLDRSTELLQHPTSRGHHRHRTMEAVMLWSYSLLTPAECQLFARLGVFSGSFSLQAVEEICQGDGIHKREILDLMASLVDKSLVGTQAAHPEARFRLHEIVRQYAHRELKESDQLKCWQDRHLQFIVGLAEKAEPHLRRDRELEWLNRLELELENIRSALRYGLDRGAGLESQDDTVELGARLAGALFVFWFIRGRFSEGRRWAEQALAVLKRTERTSPILGKLLYVMASFCFFQGDFAQAEEFSLESLRVCQASRDIFGESISLHHLGAAVQARGDLARAHEYLHQGLELATSIKDPWLISVFQTDLGLMAKFEGDLQTSLEWEKKSLDTSRQAGNKFGILYSLLNLAEMAIESDDTRQANLLAEEGLSLSGELGERRGMGFALQNLGRIAMQEGAYRRANELMRESVRNLWITRDRDSILECLIYLADNSVQAGNFDFAVRLLAACEAAKERFPAGYVLHNQSTYDRLIEMLPNHLDEGAFTAAWTLGRLMSLEQAVAYALKEDNSRHSD